MDTGHAADGLGQCLRDCPEPRVWYLVEKLERVLKLM